MRCPCDISDGQPAEAGMGIIVQNAPSSDGEGQNWALLAFGEGENKTADRVSHWRKGKTEKLKTESWQPMLLPSLVFPWKEGPACPWLLVWGSLQVSGRGCARTMPQTFPSKHPWAGGGRKGRLHVPELAQTVFWGFFFSHCVFVPPNTDKATLQGAESLGSFSPVVLCMGGKAVTVSWLWFFMTETLEISSPFNLPLLSNFSIFIVFQCENGGLQKRWQWQTDFLQSCCHSIQRGVRWHLSEGTASSWLRCLGQVMVCKNWPESNLNYSTQRGPGIFRRSKLV